MAERNRRKIVVVWSGTAAVALGAAAVAGLTIAGSGRAPVAEAAGAKVSVRPAAAATPRAAGNTGTPGTGHAAGTTAAPSEVPDLTPQAITFIRAKDPEQKVVRHVERVVQSGDYLRVYTDLPEGEENSGPAISLCEWTAEYLRGLTGEKVPIVFVHARKSDNGTVVLANKQGQRDDCQVGAAP